MLLSTKPMTQSASSTMLHSVKALTRLSPKEESTRLLQFVLLQLPRTILSLLVANIFKVETLRKTISLQF